MDRPVLRALKERNFFSLAQVGRCRALFTKQVKSIQGIYWENLGVENVLTFQVEDYGPLLAAMDNTHGRFIEKSSSD